MATIDLTIARLEWAGRLQQQAQEMRTLASRSSDPGMRQELMETAVRLTEQATKLLAAHRSHPDL